MTALRLGFIPLSDCAVLAVAEAKGFFRRHDVDVVLSREASWANIRDKLAAGVLDGAQMLAGMPLAAAAGADPIAAPVVAAFSLGLNGNAITLSEELAARMAAHPAPTGRGRSAALLRAVVDEDRRAGRPRLRFAVVHPFSSHNYQLRYWLAAAGIDPDADVQLSVVPPPRMVDALAERTVDGFCVGEPWSSLAVERGLGRIAMTSYELWNNGPEKVFGVPRTLAEREPERHRAVLRALLEAAAWAEMHRGEVAHLLADQRYVGAPAALLERSLAGRLQTAPGVAAPLPDFHVFHRYAANLPWPSHALWLLAQMLRWNQLPQPVELRAVAAAVYRDDLYRQAAADLAVPVPDISSKTEGHHGGCWRTPAGHTSIEMGSDRFFDGTTFDPDDPVGYVARFPLRAADDATLARFAESNPT